MFAAAKGRNTGPFATEISDVIGRLALDSCSPCPLEEVPSPWTNDYEERSCHLHPFVLLARLLFVSCYHHAFEIVNTIFREMKWNRKMKNRDRLEFSRSSKIPNSYFCYDENLLKLKEGVIKCNFDRMGEIILGIGIFCNVICDNFEISLL